MGAGRSGYPPGMTERARDEKPEHDDKDDVVEYFGADGEDEGQKFVDSGEASRGQDDQTIAPG